MITLSNFSCYIHSTFKCLATLPQTISGSFYFGKKKEKNHKTCPAFFTELKMWNLPFVSLHRWILKPHSVVEQTLLTFSATCDCPSLAWTSCTITSRIFSRKACLCEMVLLHKYPCLDLSLPAATRDQAAWVIWLIVVSPWVMGYRMWKHFMIDLNMHSVWICSG